MRDAKADLLEMASDCDGSGLVAMAAVMRRGAGRIAELEAIAKQLADFDGRNVMMVELLHVVALAKHAMAPQ